MGRCIYTVKKFGTFGGVVHPSWGFFLILAIKCVSAHISNKNYEK